MSTIPLDLTKPIVLDKPDNHGGQITFEDYVNNMTTIEQYINLYKYAGLIVSAKDASATTEDSFVSFADFRVLVDNGYFRGKEVIIPSKDTVQELIDASVLSVHKRIIGEKSVSSESEIHTIVSDYNSGKEIILDNGDHYQKGFTPVIGDVIYFIPLSGATVKTEEAVIVSNTDMHLITYANSNSADLAAIIATNDKQDIEIENINSIFDYVVTANNDQDITALGDIASDSLVTDPLKVPTRQEVGIKAKELQINISKNSEAITNVKTDLTTTNSGVSSNLNLINDLKKVKQDTSMVLKDGTSTVLVEDQIKDNIESISKINSASGNYVDKTSGEMGAGYTATTSHQVITQGTYKSGQEAIEKEIADLRLELKSKAESTDLGQMSLPFIPANPIAPTKNGTDVLHYVIDNTEFQAFLDANKNTDGTDKVIAGIKADFIIKDSTGKEFPGEDTWLSGHDTKNDFGTTVDASWNTAKFTLDITGLNVVDADIDRKLYQINFLVKSDAGALIDQVARDDIGDIKTHYQTKAITAGSNFTSTTVTTALNEIAGIGVSNKDALTGITHSGTTTTVATNLAVGQDITAKSVEVDGIQVATINQVVPYLTIDDTNTIAEARTQIDLLLNSREGKKTVIFDHADSNQTYDQYQGTIEIINSDPIEGTKSYFGESMFSKFTNLDDGQEYMFQLVINIVNWKVWQKRLAPSDDAYFGTAAEIDAVTDTQFLALKIKQARRIVSLKVDAASVLIDDTSLTALEARLGGN